MVADHPMYVTPPWPGLSKQSHHLFIVYIYIIGPLRPVLSLLKLSHLSTGFINVPSTYLVTSAFRELKDRMFKEIDSGLLLVGPKGCGKSVSLIALLVFLKSLKKGTVVYLSSRILKKLEIPTVKEYNEITFSKYCESSEDKAAIIKSLTSVKNYETFLLHIISLHHKQNPHERLYILIDFCQFNYIEATTLETMLNISVQSWGCVKVVAAISSGEGHTLSGVNEAYSEDVEGLLDRFESVQFTGFTELEAKAYLNIRHCEIDFHEVKNYSGTNPLLLLKWSRGMEKHIYVSKVC